MDWEIEIDATGLKCPLPVLRLRKRLGEVEEGCVVRLLATDPMAAIDVPHFCAEAGHGLLRADTQGEVAAFLVRKGG
jgi:tRNA 2-thiouridine synthesizing protein A